MWMTPFKKVPVVKIIFLNLISFPEAKIMDLIWSFSKTKDVTGS